MWWAELLNTVFATLSSGAPPVAPNSYESISTVTVGSGGSASVSFTSIPSDYTHLQIRGIACTNRGTSSGDNIGYRFNSDSGNNYACHDLIGQGSSASSSATTSTNMISGARIGGETTNPFGGFIIDILDYRNVNKYKTTKMLAGMNNNSTGFVGLTSGVWLNSNAITTITLLSATSNTLQNYSSFALYGIKGS
jgi:hypothetical protein